LACVLKIPWATLSSSTTFRTRTLIRLCVDISTFFDNMAEHTFLWLKINTTRRLLIKIRKETNFSQERRGSDKGDIFFSLAAVLQIVCNVAKFIIFRGNVKLITPHTKT
jgi:hypothetical protein